VLGFLYLISGDIVADGVVPACTDGHFPAGQTLSQQFVLPERLPSWLTEADVDFYTAELTASGFRGGLNWYRNINALPGILAPFQGRTITQPSCYVGGTLDLIAGNTPDAIEAMRAALPDLRGCTLLEGAGHWIQQERADEVTALLLGFLASLG
jgi:pimeloyl-ACP methyl ester carboxylesterase